ncbi:MAG TPA: aldo/keto reductase [Glycomyces sp.]
MEYTRLGSSGLKISRIALGCMSFANQSTGMTDWALDEEAAGPFFKQALDLGVTFWDTANAYVLATKVHFPMHQGPGGSGQSRFRRYSTNAANAAASVSARNIDSVGLTQDGTSWMVRSAHSRTPLTGRRRSWKSTNAPAPRAGHSSSIMK